MADIVQRLRDDDAEDRGAAIDLMEEAAQKIELLRAELIKSTEATSSVLRELADERDRIASSAYHQKALDRARQKALTEAVHVLNDYADSPRILRGPVVGWLPRNSIRGAAKLLAHYATEEQD